MPEGEVQILRTGGARAASARGLDILDLPSLFQALSSNRRTGTLKVSCESGEEGYLYFVEGALRLANSATAGSSVLEDAMLKARLVTREELAAIREAASAAGRSVPEEVIASGRFDNDRLKRLVVGQIVNRAADMIGWKRIHCEFTAGRLDRDHLDAALAGFSPGAISDGVLLESARRQDEWARICSVFNPESDVFELVPDRPRVEAKETWSELAAIIDGRRDVSEIIAASTMNGFEACRGLLDMIENGLVRVRPAAELARLGDLAAANSEWAKALRLFRRAYDLDDARSDLLVKMATACEALGDVRSARTHLGAFIGRSLELGQPAEAAGACRHLVRLDPENTEPRARLFRSLLALDAKEELLACGKELARLYEKERALDAASGVLTRLRELFPADHEIVELAARIRLAAAERTEAIVEFEGLAERYLADGDLENAERTFRKIVYEIDEECLEARIQLAECLIKMGRTDDAVNEYHQMAAVLSRTGVIAESAKLPFVLKINRRIAELDPKNTAAREWLAETYAARKDRKNALACLDQLLEIHEASGDRRKLAAALRRVVELFPDELGYRERLADLYLSDPETREKARQELIALCRAAGEANVFDIGIRAADKLLPLDPFHMPAHLLKALALLEAGDKAAGAERLLATARAFAAVGLSSDAREVLDAVLTTDERCAEAHRMLAVLFDADGDAASSFDHYRRAAAYDFRDGNFGLARKSLLRILELDPEDTESLRLFELLPDGLREKGHLDH